MKVSLQQILGASLGEQSSQLKASFKKTVFVRQYESEVAEVTADLELSSGITGFERIVATAILQAQIEYQAYDQLLNKGFVTKEEMASRREMLENNVNHVIAIAEQLGSESMDKFFSIKP